MDAQPNWFSLRNYATIAVYLSPPDTPSPSHLVVRDDVHHPPAATPPPLNKPSSRRSTRRVGGSVSSTNAVGDGAVASTPLGVVDDVFGLGPVANSGLALTTFVKADAPDAGLLVNGLGESAVDNAASTPTAVADTGVASHSPCVAAAGFSTSDKDAPVVGSSSTGLRGLAARARVRVDTFLDLFSVRGDATGDAPLRLTEVDSLPPTTASVASG